MSSCLPHKREREHSMFDTYLHQFGGVTLNGCKVNTMTLYPRTILIMRGYPALVPFLHKALTKGNIRLNIPTSTYGQACNSQRLCGLEVDDFCPWIIEQYWPRLRRFRVVSNIQY